MKKSIYFIPALLMAATTLSGCGVKYIGFITRLDDYVYEIKEYNELDYEGAKKFYAESNDNWGGGCTAVSTVIDGHRLVGRNMDLNISNKCAYIVRTDVTAKEKGTYKTMGLAYTFRDMSPDQNEVAKNGLPKEFYDVVPFMCDDVMNTEGFHVEINMRHGEKWANGEDKFSVDHTNPHSDDRVYMFELPQLLALHCKSLKDAHEYVDSIDVYSKAGYWNYCFLITDAYGESELLEFCFAHNDLIPNVYWTKPNEDGVVAQANFYVNKYAQQVEEIKTGLGRYATVMNEVGNCKTRVDLFNLMRKISYSNFYLPYWECKKDHFDPRSENVGEFWGAQSEILMNDELENEVAQLFDAFTSIYRSMNRQQLQDENSYWESTFTELVDPENKTIQVRMFENESKLFKLTFSGTEKITEIK